MLLSILSTVDQLKNFRVYASNDPTTFALPENLCAISTNEGGIRGDWIRLMCKKPFTSRYVFVQGEANSGNTQYQ